MVRAFFSAAESCMLSVKKQEEVKKIVSFGFSRCLNMFGFCVDKTILHKMFKKDEKGFCI